MDRKADLGRDIKIDQVINRSLNYCINKNIGLIIYRLPGTKTIHLIASDNYEKINHNNLDQLKPGYITAPFFEALDNITYIPADLHLTCEHSGDNFILDNILSGEEIIESFLYDSEKTNSISLPSATNIISKEKDKDQFIKYVSQCIEEIGKGKFKKVVPARAKYTNLPEDFNIADLYISLEKSFPNGMINLLFTPNDGLWIGATPETLIEVKGKEIFKTMALAGTQKAQDGIALKDVLWRTKEIEEQALVSRYIINCLKKIRVREFEEEGPKSIRSGNLFHLMTEFIIDIEKINFPELGQVMLELLHPTSAVCGMPQYETEQFILEHEPINRKLFAGFMGPVNVNNDTHIFVNLRCAKIYNNHILTYAGAGVTIDSDPEKEFEETELKCQSILRHL
ncbi:chorismate-binding protein [Marinigracilibium pacificum]|uniref:Chorismate-binding protein n=1 Tax=Marinigracilibium pacificum TaxID=2729599 RepID=A0A848IXE0_9BACT|nr:chorismate-binding protein [Marinigracilibium pacificum]NMM47971.1 chorismate-binding protein [Marinigracilibium pacificum]